MNFGEAMMYLARGPRETRRVTREIWNEAFQVKVSFHDDFVVNDGDSWETYSLTSGDVLAEDWHTTDKWEDR